MKVSYTCEWKNKFKTCRWNSFEAKYIFEMFSFCWRGRSLISGRDHFLSSNCFHYNATVSNGCSRQYTFLLLAQWYVRSVVKGTEHSKIIVIINPHGSLMCVVEFFLFCWLNLIIIHSTQSILPPFNQSQPPSLSCALTKNSSRVCFWLCVVIETNLWCQSTKSFFILTSWPSPARLVILLVNSNL